MNTSGPGTCLSLLAVLLLTTTAAAEAPWVAESNANTLIVMESQAKFSPESFSAQGMTQFDAKITDLKADLFQRTRENNWQLIQLLQLKKQTTKDKKVSQDLGILIKSLQDELGTAALNHEHLLPYYNLAQDLFNGFQALLDPRSDAARYPAALQRLKKYIGTEPGYTPITELAKRRTHERFSSPDLIGPYIEELEKDLDNTARFTAGLTQIFTDSGLEGWELDLTVLNSQLVDYAEWLRIEMLPRARTSHRLPEAIYADNLKNYGVDAEPRELLRQAQFGFGEIRNEMRAIAQRIAQERKLPSADYRDVMQELKKTQIPPEEILSFYRRRLTLLEDIIRREDIISLPERDAVIRLATEAESAAIPAPFLSPPQLIGNTGQPAEFVLVTSNPNSKGDEVMDDWGHDAVTWSLTAHEARPGHELQFASMIENGVSNARVLYAFNSANAEGWGLYAEAVMKEFLPLDGQLFSLQMRLIRAARAFLDPMLNLGMIEPEQARQYLIREVGLSKPMASSEIDRYTFRAPGQATSYYFGYMNMISLRTEVELRLGEKFRARPFHDFILAQGLLPPEILRAAVLEEFVPSQL